MTEKKKSTSGSKNLRQFKASVLLNANVTHPGLVGLPRQHMARGLQTHRRKQQKKMTANLRQQLETRGRS